MRKFITCLIVAGAVLSLLGCGKKASEDGIVRAETAPSGATTAQVRTTAPAGGGGSGPATGSAQSQSAPPSAQ